MKVVFYSIKDKRIFWFDGIDYVFYNYDSLYLVDNCKRLTEIDRRAYHHYRIFYEY